MLQALAEVVLLDTETFHRRFFPIDKSGQACRRALRALANGGLIRALRPIICFAGDHHGRLPTIYCLTAQGAALLTEQTGVMVKRLMRVDPKPGTLLHRLGIARDLMLPINDACAEAKLPTPEWLLEQDLYPNAPDTASFDKRFVLYEVFTVQDGTPAGTTLSLRPDASCHLRVPGLGGTPAHVNLLSYFEYDRSTVSLTALQRRLPAYQALVTTETYAKHWPLADKPTVRLFFVVRTQERLTNIATALKEIPGAALVRLTTVAELRPDTFLRAPIWQTVTGQRLTIVRSPALPA
jgi:hypothetical protein